MLHYQCIAIKEQCAKINTPITVSVVLQEPGQSTREKGIVSRIGVIDVGDDDPFHLELRPQHCAAEPIVDGRFMCCIPHSKGCDNGSTSLSYCVYILPGNKYSTTKIDTHVADADSVCTVHINGFLHHQHSGLPKDRYQYRVQYPVNFVTPRTKYHTVFTVPYVYLSTVQCWSSYR